MNRWRTLFAVTALAVPGLFYFLTPPPATIAITDPNARFRFIWISSEVLVDEILVLLLAVVFLVPLVSRYLAPVLEHKVQLPRPVKALAGLAVVVGLFLFAFWSVVDLLGGYGGPGHAFSTYPLLTTIYNGIGLNHLTLHNAQGKEGILSLSVAGLGFIMLRLKRGIGAAVRDGLAFFLAPITIMFELALWYFTPLDMYWHATGFTSWSLGRYLSVPQFAWMVHTPSFGWSGNIYLLCNWNVLVLCSFLILIPIVRGRLV